MRALIVLLLSVLGWVGVLHAETIPATVATSVPATPAYFLSNGPGICEGTMSTQTASCNLFKDCMTARVGTALGVQSYTPNCKLIVVSTGQTYLDKSYEVSYACAAGTLNGTMCETYSCPVATPAWTLQGNQCTRAGCDSRKGETVSQGYYDIGISADSLPVYVTCSGGCEATFSGSSPAATTTIAGVVHYLARGSYELDGAACSANTPPVQSGTGSIPSPTCGPGQVGGTVNGKFICVSSESGQPVSSQPPLPDNQTTTTTTTTSSNPDGTSTQTTITIGANGSKTTKTVIIGAGGQPVSSTTTGDASAEVKDTAAEDDRAAAQEKADSMPAALGPVGDRWKVAGLGLPGLSAFGALDSSQAQGILPSNMGGVVTLDVSLPYLGSMTINPAPVVNAVRPLVDFMVVMLGAIAALFAVLKKGAE